MQDPTEVKPCYILYHPGQDDNPEVTDELFIATSRWRESVERAKTTWLRDEPERLVGFLDQG